MAAESGGLVLLGELLLHLVLRAEIVIDDDPVLLGGALQGLDAAAAQGRSLWGHSGKRSSWIGVAAGECAALYVFVRLRGSHASTAVVCLGGADHRACDLVPIRSREAAILWVGAEDLVVHAGPEP